MVPTGNFLEYIGFKLLTGLFQMFSIRSRLIHNDSRSHSNESTPVLMWAPSDSAWGRTDSKVFQSHSQYLEVVERGVYSCFHSGTNGFPTIQYRRARNLCVFTYGFPLTPHWGRTDYQASESTSQGSDAVGRGILGVFIKVPTDSQWFQIAQQWIHPCSHLGSCWFSIRWEQTPKRLNLILSKVKLWKRVFQGFTIRSQPIPNNSRWHGNESTSMYIWVSTDLALGEKRLSSYPF